MNKFYTAGVNQRPAYFGGIAGGALTVRPSYYQLGQAQVGAWVATPGAIRDEAQRLHADVEQMAGEFSAQRGLGPDGTPLLVSPAQDRWWTTVWVPFYSGFTKWYEDHGIHWGLRNWYDNFWGSAWDDAQTWRRKLIDIRTSAKNLGFKFQGPDPAEPDRGWLAQLWAMLRVVAWGLGIAAGLYFLARVVLPAIRPGLGAG